MVCEVCVDRIDLKSFRIEAGDSVKSLMCPDIRKVLKLRRSRILPCKFTVCQGRSHL